MEDGFFESLTIQAQLKGTKTTFTNKYRPPKPPTPTHTANFINWLDNLLSNLNELSAASYVFSFY